MDRIISEFIKKQRVATVCCVDEQGYPYCFSCFYAYGVEGLLYFKSSTDTNHLQLLLKNNRVAGTIMPDKLNVLAIKGIQFEGQLVPADDAAAANAASRYHAKYPFALAMGGTVWTLQLNHIKMTDNSQGFGSKIQWNAEVIPEVS